MMVMPGPQRKEQSSPAEAWRMKSFSIYNKNIFAGGDGFYQSDIQSHFGRLSNGEIEFRLLLKFNNWGFCDDTDFSGRRDAPEMRIVALGDSFTVSMDSPRAWPSILEGMLRKEWPALKVNKLGLSGAGPLNWVSLRECVRRIAPEIILMPFYTGIMERPKISFNEDGRSGFSTVITAFRFNSGSRWG